MKDNIEMQNKNNDKGGSAMEKKKDQNKRIHNLEKGKAKSLGFFETISMKYAGWLDGRKNLLRLSEDGVWQSSKLKGEVDSYEEFCGKLFGHLKVEEEKAFKDMNVLFDRITPLRKKLILSKEELERVINSKTITNERKIGEEELTEAQVIARRTRERDKFLQPFYSHVDEAKEMLDSTIEEIFSLLSQITENFDSTCKIANRLLQHSQRRIDVYWRSAMRQNDELPPVPDIIFTDKSEKAFQKHYDEVKKRAEILRSEFNYSDIEKEV